VRREVGTEHPQRLRLSPLDRLEEEAASRLGQRTQQVRLALPPAATDDSQSYFRSVIGHKVSQAAPLPVSAEDPVWLGKRVDEATLL
jgi:hypothetical protein